MSPCWWYHKSYLKKNKAKESLNILWNGFSSSNYEFIAGRAGINKEIGKLAEVVYRLHYTQIIIWYQLSRNSTIATITFPSLPFSAQWKQVTNQVRYSRILVTLSIWWQLLGISSEYDNRFGMSALSRVCFPCGRTRTLQCWWNNDKGMCNVPR